MRAYLIRRLLLTVPTLFIVSFVIFVVIRFMPGDIVDAEISQMQEIGVSQASLEEARGELMKKYGLDVPIYAQYGRWIGAYPQADGTVSGLLQGDFGTSFRRHTPVLRDIAIRWPVTLELGLIAFVIANLISLPIGVYSALRQDTVSDYLVRSFAIMCMAVPSFWLGTMIVVFPSLWWGYSPPIMYRRMTEDLFANLEMFVVPAIARATFFEADIHSWPVSDKNAAAFIPMDQLPASSQELFEYNPEKAKQLLADAGYPNGFTVIAPVNAADTTRVDMLSQIADQWSKIGVTVDMRPMESAALSEFMRRGEDIAPNFDMWLHGEYNIDPLITIGGRFGHYFHEDFLEAKQTPEGEARMAILRDIAARAIDEVVPGIPLGTPYQLRVTWPWVKNWYGETEESAWGTAHINARIWIDQELKKSLGY